MRLKVIGKILRDLEELKDGQARIEEQLRHQTIVLLQVLENTEPPPVALHVVFRVLDPSGLVIEEAIAVEVKINQQFECQVEFQDQAGNVATVDEPPEWSADPDGILTLEPSEDGLTTIVKSGTKTGSAQVLCKADADMGSGVAEITGMLAVTVLPGDAITVTLNPGEVSDIPAGPGPATGRAKRW